MSAATTSSVRESMRTAPKTLTQINQDLTRTAEASYVSVVRGTDDLYLLDSPMPELLQEVIRVKRDRSGKHAILNPAGVRSAQRLALGDVGGGSSPLPGLPNWSSRRTTSTTASERRYCWQRRARDPGTSICGRISRSGGRAHPSGSTAAASRPGPMRCRRASSR
jgi:hypothetical protein